MIGVSLSSSVWICPATLRCEERSGAATYCLTRLSYWELVKCAAFHAPVPVVDQSHRGVEPGRGPELEVAVVHRLIFHTEFDGYPDGRRGLRHDLRERRDLLDILGHQRGAEPRAVPGCRQQRFGLADVLRALRDVGVGGGE